MAKTPILKQAIAISISVAILFLGYYGSYLPMRKSVLFIRTIQSAGEMKTIKDFEQGFSVPLDYPSPIGQEELVRNAANTTIGSVQNISPEGVDELMNYIKSYYDPIIRRGRGMSFGQNLYLLGALNELAFLKTNKTQYINDAEKYFAEARRLGPRRPQGLYGLFDVYRIKGDAANAAIVGKQILSQWPSDERVKGILQSLKEGTSSDAKAK